MCVDFCEVPSLLAVAAWPGSTAEDACMAQLLCHPAITQAWSHKYRSFPVIFVSMFLWLLEREKNFYFCYMKLYKTWMFSKICARLKLNCEQTIQSFSLHACHLFTLSSPFPSLLTCTNPTSSTGNYSPEIIPREFPLGFWRNIRHHSF